MKFFKALLFCFLAALTPELAVAQCQTLAAVRSPSSPVCSQSGQAVPCPIDATIPSYATAAGYTVNTFNSSSAFTTANVDMSQTSNSGFQWYLWNFFGESTTSSTVTLNSDGSTTMYGGNGNAQLASAAAKGSSFVGTAFGGGGYFEAVLKFNPSNVNVGHGWPAWWTMAIEHLAGLSGQQWTGQTTGYDHYIEDDVFEYITSGLAPNYDGTLHDWYGIYNVTCSGYCGIHSNPYNFVLPASTDWTAWHKYGMLWIPATSTTSGSISFYFDGAQVGSTLTYTQYTGQTPPPTSQSWLFGVIDQQHLALILGAGTDTNVGFTVRSVNVWQASTAGNITH